jgi:hypothetical protein
MLLMSYLDEVNYDSTIKLIVAYGLARWNRLNDHKFKTQSGRVIVSFGRTLLQSLSMLDLPRIT